MTDLLELALAAHGGLVHWNAVNRITARVSIGGGLWSAKGQGGILDSVRISLDCHKQHVEYWPFGARGRHSVYEPDNVAIEADDGRVLESRRQPRAAFDGHVRETQWDRLHLVYFSGYAIWTYLTTPFLFTMPGFEYEEIEPWLETEEIWRRLKVTFPENVPSHSREQVFYFDDSGMLKRHDYSADVVGALPSANYATEPQRFSGLFVPTQRRVFARGPDNRPNRNRIAVSIDFHDLVAS
jgi:hypothetical protein